MTVPSWLNAPVKRILMVVEYESTGKKGPKLIEGYLMLSKGNNLFRLSKLFFNLYRGNFDIGLL